MHFGYGDDDEQTYPTVGFSMSKDNSLFVGFAAYTGFQSRVNPGTEDLCDGNPVDPTSGAFAAFQYVDHSLSTGAGDFDAVPGNIFLGDTQERSPDCMPPSGLSTSHELSHAHDLAYVPDSWRQIGFGFGSSNCYGLALEYGGSNRIITFSQDCVSSSGNVQSGAMANVGELQASTLTKTRSPRRVAMHPTKKFAFVIFKDTAEVGVVTLDWESSSTTPFSASLGSHYTTLPTDGISSDSPLGQRLQKKEGIDVAVHPTLEVVYALTWGKDADAVHQLSFSESSGRLEKLLRVKNR